MTNRDALGHVSQTKARVPGVPGASGTRGFDYDPLRGSLTQERWTPDRGALQAGALCLGFMVTAQVAAM